LKQRRIGVEESGYHITLDTRKKEKEEGSLTTWIKRGRK
jgi:hypothetical protein